MTISIRESLSIKLSNVSNLRQQLEKKSLFPFRYFVILLLFFAATISFAVRCVINVAILAMVNEDSTTSTDQLNSTVIKDEIKFNWDQQDQGLVLGAYFYTYTAAQIISGILTDKFNAVHLMTASQLAAIACTFLCPIAAEYGIIYLVAARMALGLAHGLLFPSCYILMERWLVPTEKAFAQSCVAVGSNFGIVIIMPLTAWLCDNGFAGGWPSAFYVTAAVNILFIIIWIITMTLDPSDNRWVSQSEKNFLDKMTSAKVVKSKITKTPWISMLTSLPLWSVMITRGINGLIYYAINTKIPVYMEMVLGYQLQGNGLINSLFYVAICSTQLISGPMARWVIGKKWFSRTVTRKIFESIALFGTALCLGIIPSLGNRPDVIIIVLIASMFCNGFTIGGDTPIVMEMAPHLVGTAFGFANTLGCASGFIAPVIIAAIIGEQVHSQSLWNTTFYTFAGLQMIGAFSFLTFATTKPQPWGTVETPSKPKDKTEINSNPEDLYDISSKV